MNKIPNYRVWHKIEKRFVDLRTIDFELESIGYDCYGEANYYDVAKFDEIVFQQFTGLYDKNKKPIYEGDIISYLQHLFNASPDKYPVKTKEVKWKNMKGCWNVYESRAGEDNLEVIGNIFQLPCNPDHNGECLVCDEWLDGCPFDKEKVEDDLQKLVKEDPMWQKPL